MTKAGADPQSDTGAGPGVGQAARLILAIDTSLDAVSVCLFDVRANTPVAAESMMMDRGHAEALLPLLDRLVSSVDGQFSALGRVAVTIGPGSFTGIRVGVAAARALGLACKIPVVGVSTLAALAAPLITGSSQARIVAAVDARHGHVYAQVFAADGGTVMEARHASVAETLAHAGPGPIRLVGSGAPMIAIEARSGGVTADVAPQGPIPDIALVARLGSLADPDHAPPKPLYLKPPDAKPQALPDPTQSAPSVP